MTTASNSVHAGLDAYMFFFEIGKSQEISTFIVGNYQKINPLFDCKKFENNFEFFNKKGNLFKKSFDSKKKKIRKDITFQIVPNYIFFYQKIN